MSSFILPSGIDLNDLIRRRTHEHLTELLLQENEERRLNDVELDVLIHLIEEDVRREEEEEEDEEAWRTSPLPTLRPRRNAIPSTPGDFQQINIPATLLGHSGWDYFPLPFTPSSPQSDGHHSQAARIFDLGDDGEDFRNPFLQSTANGITRGLPFMVCYSCPFLTGRIRGPIFNASEDRSGLGHGYLLRYPGNPAEEEAMESVSPLESPLEPLVAQSPEYDGGSELGDGSENSLQSFFHFSTPPCRTNSLDSYNSVNRTHPWTDAFQNQVAMVDDLVDQLRDSQRIPPQNRIPALGDLEDLISFRDNVIFNADDEDNASICSDMVDLGYRVLAFLGLMEEELGIYAPARTAEEDAESDDELAYLEADADFQPDQRPSVLRNDHFADFNGVHHPGSPGSDDTLPWALNNLSTQNEDNDNQEVVLKPDDGLSTDESSSSQVAGAVSGFRFVGELIGELERVGFFLASRQFFDELDVEG